MAKINAAEAMLKVMEAWGIDHIFGLPGGSIDSTMDALYKRSDTMKYIQVRHEEVGALAASGESKVTGKISAVFGSAGPGAVHLLNGLYDAKHDHVPVLALVGQVGTAAMNTDYFQELNENPMFEDVSVYNRTVMTAEQLPSVIDTAIQEAIKYNGVAVVTLPTDLGWQSIEDDFEPTSYAQQYQSKEIVDESVAQSIIDLIQSTKKPIIYFGKGASQAGIELEAISEKLQMPMASSALAKGIVPDSNPAYMVSAGRVATKPGVDLLRAADLVMFVGSNYEFGKFFFDPQAKFIQIDTDNSKLGHRHHIDIGLKADAKVALSTILKVINEQSDIKVDNSFYQAAIEDKKNWQDWIAKRAGSQDTPIKVERVYQKINEKAASDAIFNSDVGNVTIDSVRLLDMNTEQKLTTSAWYATMGNALPGAIGTQVKFPKRQSWSISGDGGFAMILQDVITQVKYNLPVINIILNNETLGFIEAEQDDTKQHRYGVDLHDANYAEISKAMGAEGYRVTTQAELDEAFEQIGKTDKPIVIDIKIDPQRPFPVEKVSLDSLYNDPSQLDAFIKDYQAEDLKPFNTFLKAHNL